jgi:hypothetical protein
MNTTIKEKEALINELKGNLFEYLIGLFLSKIHQIEANFHRNFSGEIKEKLTRYEIHLLKNDPYLFKKLPFMAKEVAQKINNFLPSKIDNIFVVGMAGFRFNLKETDILVISNNEKIPISVKLCKANSFVNTKSAGVKSFIKNYFQDFEMSGEWQNQLNILVDLSFEKMARKMHEIAGLEFKGGFYLDWEESGFSHLPGKLPTEMKKILYQFYFEINSKIFDIFFKMESISPAKLNKCLFPLLGFGEKGIIRMTCYHSDNYSSLKFTLSSLDQLKDGKLGRLKDGLSSFEIIFPGRILQIRVKPMNVFTTPAVKINCSTKDVI